MNSPHGRTFYGLVGAFALATACLFSWAIFISRDITGAFAVLTGAIPVIFFLGALQAAERFFRPDSATARSGALSPASRQKLLGTGKSIFLIAFLVSLISPFVHSFGSGTIRDAANDAGEIACVFMFIAWCIADFCGERLTALLGR